MVEAGDDFLLGTLGVYTLGEGGKGKGTKERRLPNKKEPAWPENTTHETWQ